ncbi:GNAT family N-acetyltransferase [Priestia megaterium]|uniref:GNAT family N-acetyltransferase n=1 Tax=Priestia megaterium TaxID=1404 RepID=UPI0031012072
MLEFTLVKDIAEQSRLKEMYQYEFLSDIESNYVIKVAEQLVGFIQINRYVEEKFINDYDMERYIINDLGDENTIVIEKLFIEEKYRGNGYGTLFVDWVKTNYTGGRILLCSLYEVEDFWRYQGFVPVEYPHKEYPEDIYETDVYCYVEKDLEDLSTTLSL